jgi:hypothetical protein
VKPKEAPILCLVLAAASFTAGRAGAESSASPVTLDWDAPPSCPTQAEMLARIARIVGGKTSSTPVRARVVVTSDAEGVRAALELSGAGEGTTRSLADATCPALADAIALIIALAVSPEAPPVAAPLVRASSPPPLATPSSPSVAFRLGASALLDALTFPAPAAGGELSAALHVSRAFVEVDGALLAAQRISLSASPNEGATFTVIHAGLRGGYLVVVRPFELAPVAGAGVDWILARGFGSQVPADATASVAVLSLGLRATIPLSHALAARVGFEGVAPLSRPTFVIDERGTVYTTPSAFLRASAGIEVHF